MNMIRSIKTEAGYDMALAKITTLMDAEPGTPEGDQLDVLVALVEAYEAKHWRIDPPDPIEAIKLRMQQHRKLIRTFSVRMKLSQPGGKLLQIRSCSIISSFTN